MPPKSSKGVKKSRRPTKAAKKSTQTPKRGKTESRIKVADRKLDPAAEHFVRGVLIRGEAAKPAPDGSLPPGVTHKIVDEEEDLPRIEREGFSIY